MIFVTSSTHQTTNLVVGGRSNDTRGGRVDLMHSRTEPLIKSCHLSFIMAYLYISALSHFKLNFKELGFQQREGNDLVLRGDLGPWLAHDLVTCDPLPRTVPRSHPPSPILMWNQE